MIFQRLLKQTTLILLPTATILLAWSLPAEWCLKYKESETALARWSMKSAIRKIRMLKLFWELRMSMLRPWTYLGRKINIKLTLLKSPTEPIPDKIELSEEPLTMTMSLNKDFHQNSIFLVTMSLSSKVCNKRISSSERLYQNKWESTTILLHALDSYKPKITT